MSGTSGRHEAGQAVGQLALVARPSGRRRAASTVKAVRTTIATSGAGTALVSRGSRTRSRDADGDERVDRATARRSGAGTWARKIRIARALTKPTITERGMNRISLATPNTPSTIWMTPARMTVAIR